VKPCTKNLSLVAVLLAGLGLIPVGWARAQTFTTLHSFPECGSSYAGGSSPIAGLVLSGNTLYGTASGCGNGAVFRINTDGTGFTNLHSFTGLGDGAHPWAGLVLSGNTLYGTARDGGSSGNGAVFKGSADGTGFTSLHSFTAAGGPPYTNSDGAQPYAGLILSGDTLYGTAYAGGSSHFGAVFAVNTDGTGFTNLHSFTGGSDGGYPRAGLILSGNSLYGTTESGGSGGAGAAFKVSTDGTGFTSLHSFTGGSDGGYPWAGLVLSGNTLYGTTPVKGTTEGGTVFSVNTDGTGFTNLHSFRGSDGFTPKGGLVLSGNTLYGTTGGGGSFAHGTVFSVNTDGTGFTSLHSFTGGNDGAYPYAGVILSGSTLYGTAYDGGSLGAGTVFSLSLPPPQLTVIRSVAGIVLTWPTNAAGFTLQSTTNLVSPSVWTTVSPGPAVVNGQNAVTNPISGAQKF
jgi:uncharacterized repeat protein (TIGR03803 family)